MKVVKLNWFLSGPTFYTVYRKRAGKLQYLSYYVKRPYWTKFPAYALRHDTKEQAETTIVEVRRLIRERKQQRAMC